MTTQSGSSAHEQRILNTPIVGTDGKLRCHWVGTNTALVHYHDHEWGFPVDDDRRLFEKLSLEAFQSGLSWRTILAKRENFRAAFDNFDFNVIADYDQQALERLVTNAGIVRHRGKIEALINNARRAQELVEQEGSLAQFIWRFQPIAAPLVAPQTATTSVQSIALSAELKKRGWKFVGPTTVYAFMQAMGLINDHVDGCVIKTKVESARKRFKTPGK